MTERFRSRWWDARPTADQPNMDWWGLCLPEFRRAGVVMRTYWSTTGARWDHNGIHCIRVGYDHIFSSINVWTVGCQPWCPDFLTISEWSECVLLLQIGIICFIFACETVHWHCFSFFRTHFRTLICDSCLCCSFCRWLAAVISGALVEIINIPLWLCELCCNALGPSGVF